MNTKADAQTKLTAACLLFILCICSCGEHTLPAGAQADSAAKDTNENWRLAAAAYSFRNFTFFEAIDKTASLGLVYIESYEWQRISGDIPEHMNQDRSEEVLRRVKKKLDSAGVRLVNHYIGVIPGDEAGCRKVFEFARKMGIETLVSEPEPEKFDIIERFCDEYGVNLAVHNHPKPNSRYWHPIEVLNVCEGRSKRIGACADTGHWARSGIRPAEAVKTLEGRIISFHVKDLNEFGNPKAHDVPWGTGKGELDAMFTELKRGGFKGVFSIEYEHHPENPIPEIQQCVEYFNNKTGN